MPSAPTTTDDPYEFTDGFEFSGIIDGPYFGYDQGYMNGQSGILILELDPLDGEGDTRRQFFSYGDGWNISDDGQHIAHVSNEPTKRLNGGSNLAKLVASAVKLPGVKEIFTSRGAPTDAAIWDGLAFDFVTTSKESVIRNETRVSRTTTVTAFYPNLSRNLDGVSGGKADAPLAPEIGAWGIPTIVEADLTNLASSSTSHGEFQARAMAEVNGVEGDLAAEGLVADPAFYETLRGN